MVKSLETNPIDDALNRVSALTNHWLSWLKEEINRQKLEKQKKDQEKKLLEKAEGAPKHFDVMVDFIRFHWEQSGNSSEVYKLQPFKVNWEIIELSSNVESKEWIVIRKTAKNWEKSTYTLRKSKWFGWSYMFFLESWKWSEKNLISDLKGIELGNALQNIENRVKQYKKFEEIKRKSEVKRSNMFAENTLNKDSDIEWEKNEMA